MTNQEAIKILDELKKCYLGGIVDAIDMAIEAVKAQEPITGETSDGYHTFNELYHHRAVLFSVIVNNYKDLAWKSVRHHDGTMYDGMFIVGIDTPDGQATYHYDIDPYWDMFDCKVREFAPEWDGHTPAQAIERIRKLKALEKMKLCPFCGGNAKLSIKDGGSWGRIWYVNCTKCNARTEGWREPSDLGNFNNPYTKITETVETAIEAWNRRMNNE